MRFLLRNCLRGFWVIRRFQGKAPEAQEGVMLTEQAVCACALKASEICRVRRPIKGELQPRSCLSTATYKMGELTRPSSKRAAVMVVVATMMCLFAIVAEGAGSTQMNVMVPAYFDPSANPTLWSRLNSAAASLPNRVVAIANVNSGPGTATQATYYRPVIQALQNKSGRVIGYVPTNYGATPIATVQANVNSWFSFYPSLNGIFFDEAAYTTGKQAYYQTLYNYVKLKNSSSLVVTNPGTSTLESYLIYNGSRVADIICIHESNASALTWTQAAWTSNYDRSNFYAIFWNVSDINVAAFDYGDVIDHAYQQNVGWIYVTSDNDSNPYDSLPPYFSGEITYIKNDNYL